MSDWIGNLKSQIVTPYGANMVTGVSGPNETDVQFFGYNGLTSIPAANAAQADLFTQIKADVALSGIPVDMWPAAFPSGYTAIGDQTAHCDRVNLHDYYGVDNTSIQSYTGTIPVAMLGYLSDARHSCNRVPWITTESGYGSTACGGCSQSASPYAQARLVMMDMFDHARLPDLKQYYHFTQRWGPSTGNWGLINDDGTPKPSGTAVRAMMKLLNDPGASASTFSPAAFSYSLSGMPGQGRDFLIAKSDGSYVLLLYQETPIWNVAAATPIALSNSTVTVTLSQSMSGSVYNPIVNGVAPTQTITNMTSFTATLNDAPLIITLGNPAPTPPPP